MTWQCKWLEINVGSGHPMETKEAATFFWVRGWMAQPAKEADRSEENQTNHSEVGEFIANIFPSSLQMVGPMPHQNSRLPLYIYMYRCLSFFLSVLHSSMISFFQGWNPAGAPETASICARSCVTSRISSIFLSWQRCYLVIAWDHWALKIRMQWAWP